MRHRRADARSRTWSPSATPTARVVAATEKTPYGRFCTGNGESSGTSTHEVGHASSSIEQAERERARRAGSVTPQHPNDRNAWRTRLCVRVGPAARASGSGARVARTTARSSAPAPSWASATEQSTLSTPCCSNPSSVVRRTAWCSPAVSLNGERRGRRRLEEGSQLGLATGGRSLSCRRCGTSPRSTAVGGEHVQGGLPSGLPGDLDVGLRGEGEPVEQRGRGRAPGRCPSGARSRPA